MRLLPGSVLSKSVLFGIPPCFKIFLQKKLPPPTAFVLPDTFYAHGVVQVCLEFFVYHFLFVQGKAFGKLPADAKLVIVGTRSQCDRVRRMLELSLFGPTPAEMKRWKDRDGSGSMSKRAIALLRHHRAWFAPKRAGFEPPKTDEFEKKLEAFESAMLTLEDFIEWRVYDASGRATLPDGRTVVHRGDNTFEVAGETIDLRFDEPQAPYLVATPPQPRVIEPEVFQAVCLGSDTGFELEHPTTGFAFSVNGEWVLVDAPVCASYLLTQYGINPADVRVVLETHGHEDHMGANLHFLLECMTHSRHFVYLAAEPIYRTSVAKIAAVLGMGEDEVDKILSTGASPLMSQPRERSYDVVRVKPGASVRLLGAVWEFFYQPHPIPTTGFRVSLDHAGKPLSLTFSSDTLSDRGVRDMVREGFMAEEYAKFLAGFPKGDEVAAFWEAGGTGGDAIHYDAHEWKSRGRRVPVVFMHTHSLPVELRSHELARPGMSWTYASMPRMTPKHLLSIERALSTMKVRDPAFWTNLFVSQGREVTFRPDETIVAEGEKGGHWYVLLSGVVEVRIDSRLVTRLSDGEFFGELSIVENVPRQATVTALGPVQALEIPKNLFLDFVGANDLVGFFRDYWHRGSVLEKTRLFIGFPHAVVAKLALRAERRTYEEGDVILRQGTQGEDLFVIEEGAVSVTRSDADGKSQAVTVRGPSEVIGEVGALVPSAKRTASCRAQTKTTVLVLRRSDIHEIITGDLPLEVRLVSLLRDRGILSEARSEKSTR